MGSFRSALPSKSAFYRASDFDAGPITVTIAKVSTENIGDEGAAERKLILSFREANTKKLVMNLTRCESVTDVAGSEDVDDWPGVRISIRKGMTRFQGQRVPCMVIAAPATRDDIDESMPTLREDDR